MFLQVHPPVTWRGRASQLYSFIVLYQGSEQIQPFTHNVVDTLVTRLLGLQWLCKLYLQSIVTSWWDGWSGVLFSARANQTFSVVQNVRTRFSLQAGQSRDRIPVGGEIFCTCPDKSWGPPSLLYNGYWVSPRGKAVGAWFWPPTPNLAPRLKEK